MNFELTSEQELLKDSVGKLTERQLPMSKIRGILDQPEGQCPEFWRALADGGYLAALIPEEFGGAGLGYLEMACILEPLGAVLAPGPYFTTAVAATEVLKIAGSKAQQFDILPGIARGEIIAGLVYDSGFDNESIPVSVEQEDGGWRLRGEQAFVPYANLADWLIVPALAKATGKAHLFLVESGTAGISSLPQPTMDQTRRWDRLQFNDVSLPGGAELGAADAISTLKRVLATCAALKSAEMLGGAAKVLEMAVSYAKERKQFDVPVGGFQAVKHMLADMLIALEGMRSAVYSAAWALGADPAAAALDAAVAKVVASETYLKLSEDNIQIHGGIGFTWELDAHLYLKRAQLDRQSHGTPREHYHTITSNLEELA